MCARDEFVFSAVRGCGSDGIKSRIREGIPCAVVPRHRQERAYLVANIFVDQNRKLGCFMSHAISDYLAWRSCHVVQGNAEFT